MRTAKLTAPKKRPVETRKPVGYAIRLGTRRLVHHAACAPGRRYWALAHPHLPPPEPLTAYFEWPKGAKCWRCDGKTAKPLKTPSHLREP